MLIQSDETENFFDDKNICLICYDNLNNNDNISILKCCHKYHYNCILLSYRKVNKRICPYCRSDGGFLDLPKGVSPEYKIHYTSIYNKEQLKIKYIEGKCKYILKQGKNKGKQCSFNSKTENDFCNRHNKIIIKTE